MTENSLQPNEQLTDIWGSPADLSFPEPEIFIQAEFLGFVAFSRAPRYLATQ